MTLCRTSPSPWVSHIIWMISKHEYLATSLLLQFHQRRNSSKFLTQLLFFQRSEKTDSNETNLILIAIHTQPKNAAAEIDKLDDVRKWTTAKYQMVYTEMTSRIFFDFWLIFENTIKLASHIGFGQFLFKTQPPQKISRQIWPQKVTEHHWEVLSLPLFC